MIGWALAANRGERGRCLGESPKAAGTETTAGFSHSSGGQKSRVQELAGLVPSEGCGGASNPFLLSGSARLRQPPASLAHRCATDLSASRGILPEPLCHLPSVCVCVQISPFIRTKVIRLGHPNDLIVTTPAKTLHPNKTPTTGAGVRTPTYFPGKGFNLECCQFIVSTGRVGKVGKNRV